MAEQKKTLVIRAKDREGKDERGDHPWNPNSEMYGFPLGDTVGLQRIGFWFLRLPPGKESFVYHSHQLEEELLYVLSGRGVVEIDGEKHELGPGDFVGFPTPSAAHHLTNPFSEELVYLSCGERREVEVADYPREGKRMVRVGKELTVFPLSAVEKEPFKPRK